MTSPTPAPPVRFCPICKQADDHPRHDFFLTDPNVSPHMDCCAANGCPDGSCPILVAEKGSKKGNTFREHLVANVEKNQRALDKRDDATRHFTLADLDPTKHGAIVQSPIDLTEVTQ